MYDSFGRPTAYAVAGATMLVLIVGGLALAGPAWRLRGDAPQTPVPVAAPAAD
jgi:hypothetical protein